MSNFNVPVDNENPWIDNRISTAWYQFFASLRNSIVGRTQYGTSAQRPTKNLEIGLTYYDTTLGYLICVHTVSPLVWHNGAGMTV